jgi:branched-chain amino acid transport system permease protein
MTQFLNFFFTGIAKGSTYALIALGFVIIYRATHVLNFGQGSIIALGAYLFYMFLGPPKDLNVAAGFHISSLPYPVALILGMVLAAGVGWALEFLVIRRFRGRPVFAVIMATLGVGYILDATVASVWGTTAQSVREPFTGMAKGGLIKVGSINILVVDIITFVISMVVMTAFFVFFRKSRVGTAMRATAFDQEAATAQGISPSRIFGLSWAIAAAMATLAGVLLASGAGSTPNGVAPSLTIFALFGFPAIVLGGLDSAEGAVLGGFTIGIVEQLVAGYSNKFNWVGDDFQLLAPFIVMVLILVFRPNGFFGSKEVRRV